jgi:hypothetical protein
MTKKRSNFNNFFSVSLKLWNNKQANHLIEGFPMDTKSEAGL